MNFDDSIHRDPGGGLSPADDLADSPSDEPAGASTPSISASTASANDHAVALSNCASEPIHIPGTVQSFGGVIGLGVGDEVVHSVSENLGDITDRSDWLGQNLSDCIGNRDLYHDIRGAMGLPTVATQRERLGVFDLAVNGADPRPVDVAVHRSGESWVVEFEPDREVLSRPDTSVSQVRGMLATLQRRPHDESLLDVSTKILRRVTGFDRVMAYVFLDDGDGEVRAEAARPGLDPFLGLRYPASDIPPQARQAMVKMPFRCNADIHTAAVPIQQTPGTPPLDLSLAHVRGISPIHTEYLRNMGVRSSVNLAILLDGHLWGLFALHHDRPMLLSPRLRSICELFADLFSQQMAQQIRQQTVQLRQRVASLKETFIRLPADGDQAASDDRRVDRSDEPQRGSDGGLRQRIADVAEDLCRVVDADGLLLIQPPRPGGRCFDHDCFGHGLYCDPAAVDGHFETAEWMAVETPPPELNLVSNDGQSIAGVLALTLNPEHRTRLLFFRRPESDMVRWAGMPDKDITFGPNGPRLHPRASFAQYVQTVQGRSRRWTQPQIDAATELRYTMIDLMLRDTSRDHQVWSRQREQQTLLIAELNHRVKNILALVRSIAQQTKTSAVSVEQFVQSFEARISALAKSHELTNTGGDRWVSLETLLMAELHPHIDAVMPPAPSQSSSHTPPDATSSQSGNASPPQPHRRIDWSGPPVTLRGDATFVLSLVLHELVTNAVKYGALSPNVPSRPTDPDADPDVQVGTRDQPRLRIQWKPSDGGLAVHWDEIQPASQRLTVADHSMGGDLVSGDSVAPLHPRPVGPSVATAPPGFGMSLIRQAIPHQCGGESTVRSTESGLEVRLWLPSPQVRFGGASTPPAKPDHQIASTNSFDATTTSSTPEVISTPAVQSATFPADQPATSPADQPTTQSAGQSSGQSSGQSIREPNDGGVAESSETTSAMPRIDGAVLIVEDNLLIAMETERILRALGQRELRVAADVASAMRTIQSDRIGLAVLDVNLGRTTSFEVAEKLLQLEIPVVFTTGYGHQLDLPPALRAFEVVAKPIDVDHLRSAIHRTVVGLEG